MTVEISHPLGHYCFFSSCSSVIALLALLSLLSSGCGSRIEPFTSDNGEGSAESNTKGVISQEQDPHASSLQYCVRILEAESEVGITEPCDSLEELGSRCQQLSIELNNISTRGVDRFFIDWTGRYSELLMNMSEWCEVMSKRGRSDYQVRRMLEACVRGAQGDALGVAIEEMSANEIQKELIIFFTKRRLQLLFEFQREFNAIAPESAKAVVKE